MRISVVKSARFVLDVLVPLARRLKSLHFEEDKNIMGTLCAMIFMPGARMPKGIVDGTLVGAVHG